MNPVVVVHGGGASNISKDRKESVRQGVMRAATVGYNVLKEGGSAVDAVEGAVVVLENDPEFNTPHCFLTDQGATKFATAMGVPQIPGEQLVTERNTRRLEKEKREKGAQKPDCRKYLGTVGAVALDCNGNVAYATSTGGIVNKMVGRVGDSPCVGSGGYADNNIGAVSTTGHGESILKVNLARLTLFHIEQGKTLDEAASLSLGYMKSRLKGLGGLIVVDKAGDWVVKWTSTSMPWAAARDGKLHSGIDLDESTVVDLP
ncbi:isoaspartyl peptidase/L-asparaginase [Orycteropus afer afer]|uniref:Isoaspartyl peptidase/L-asparaginase n=1 Tax=Orycteropus afer afer TaxID=1230840 RepID=A0A8B7A5H2_ORYAF|nr:isoaspartyl peptidase/L-asparaginase [Orycteropus afer afer]